MLPKESVAEIYLLNSNDISEHSVFYQKYYLTKKAYLEAKEFVKYFEGSWKKFCSGMNKLENKINKILKIEDNKESIIYEAEDFTLEEFLNHIPELEYFEFKYLAQRILLIFLFLVHIQRSDLNLNRLRLGFFPSIEQNNSYELRLIDYTELVECLSQATAKETSNDIRSLYSKNICLLKHKITRKETLEMVEKDESAFLIVLTQFKTDTDRNLGKLEILNEPQIDISISDLIIRKIFNQRIQNEKFLGSILMDLNCKSYIKTYSSLYKSRKPQLCEDLSKKEDQLLCDYNRNEIAILTKKDIFNKFNESYQLNYFLSATIYLEIIKKEKTKYNLTWDDEVLITARMTLVLISRESRNRAFESLKELEELLSIAGINDPNEKVNYLRGIPLVKLSIRTKTEACRAFLIFYYYAGFDNNMWNEAFEEYSYELRKKKPIYAAVLYVGTSFCLLSTKAKKKFSQEEFKTCKKIFDEEFLSSTNLLKQALQDLKKSLETSQKGYNIDRRKSSVYLRILQNANFQMIMLQKRFSKRWGRVQFL